MRRIYERSSASSLLRPARFLLVSLFLMTLLPFFGTTRAVFAQSTAEVCRETKKVYYQNNKEHDEVTRTIRIIKEVDKVRNYLSELRRAIATGYRMSGLENAAAFAGLDSPGSPSPKEMLVFQKTVRSALERELQKALDSNEDDLRLRQDRLQEQLWTRSQRMRDLNCNEVLKRESEETSEVSIAGTWKAGGINYVYEITQTGNTFTWVVTNQPNLNETATGKFLGRYNVRATWTNKNGTAGADGRVTIDGAGKVTRIDWSNGIVFERN